MSSRRVAVVIAGVATSAALVIVGPGDTALGANPNDSDHIGARGRNSPGSAAGEDGPDAGRGGHKGAQGPNGPDGRSIPGGRGRSGVNRTGNGGADLDLPDEAGAAIQRRAEAQLRNALRRAARARARGGN